MSRSRAPKKYKVASNPENYNGLSTQAASKIIAKYGSMGSFSNEDRDHFRDAVNLCYIRYCIRETRQDREEATKRSRQTRLVAKSAKQIVDIMAGPDTVLYVELAGIYESDELYVDWHIDDPDAPPLQTLLMGLRALSAAAIRSSSGDKAARKKDKTKDWVLELSAIYSKHVGQAARRQRASSGKRGGPCSKFIEAVSYEFGVRITAETIHAYLGPKYRSGR